jgi:YidC/Oxa1 family membrane protein insertase
MERRVLLAVFLSFLVLVLYQRLVGPPPSPVDLVAGESLVATGVPSDGAVTRSAVELPRRGEPIIQPFIDSVSTVVADDRARDIVVESDLVRAVFANRGAELVSWQLKSYEEGIGSPVELVPPNVEPDQIWPFTLLVPGDPDLTARLDEALFRPSLDRLRLTNEPATLVFDYEDSSGLQARKSFTFQASEEQPYVVGFSASVTTTQGAVPVTLQWGPALGGVRENVSRMTFQQLPGAVVYGRAVEDGLLQDVDIYREDPSDLVERPIYEGELKFAGVDNHYFMVAALPGEGQSLVDFLAVSTVSVEHDLVAFNLAVGSNGAEVPIFIGPKDFDVLAAVDADLVRAIDFGWLSVLVVPLHRTLKWIYGFVGNYGWSIILLTVLINLVIFPLRHKSVTSMRKMSELQPEMKAIQARYAALKTTDPAKQKMNQEVMELYRGNGVNPASGCLPMLLTMPILIAFYRLLSAAIEMRGAPFILWITDLSMHDPLYITPVVMGASMVVQQRLQPAQADPMQAKIMMLMPVMFTFMFLWAPSGLVIYWLTSNMIGIGQQLLTNRIAGPTRTRQVRPSAERQVKRVGVGALDGDVDPAAVAKQIGRGTTRSTSQGKGTRRSRGKGGES